MRADDDGWRAALYDRDLEPMNAPLRQVARRLVTTSPQSVVLDVGSGTGAALAEHRRDGCRVLGADPPAARLRQARRRLGDDADLRLMTGPVVPFEDGCADLVLVSLRRSTPCQQRSQILAA